MSTDLAAEKNSAAPSNTVGRAAKFLFDLSFDADAPPPEPEAPPPLSLTQEELATIKAASFEDGRNAGRTEALNNGADKAAAQLAQLTSLVQQLAADGSNRDAASLDTIVEAVKAVAQNLLPAYVTRYGFAEMEAIVRDCLSQLKGEARLVIRVTDSDLDDAIKRFEGLAQAAAFPGKLIILADNTLSPGDLRVEWADGGLERTTGTLWSEIERILAHANNTTNMNGDQHG